MVFLKTRPVPDDFPNSYHRQTKCNGCYVLGAQRGSLKGRALPKCGVRHHLRAQEPFLADQFG